MKRHFGVLSLHFVTAFSSQFDRLYHSVPDNFQSQGVNEEFCGVNRCGSLPIFLSSLFTFSGQEASFLGFLT